MVDSPLMLPCAQRSLDVAVALVERRRKLGPRVFLDRSERLGATTRRRSRLS
jgi:hypothetical protein